MSNETERATKLLNASYYAGLLSKDSAGALAALPQHCEEVGRALGSDATGHDVMLVTILVDDSTSIEHIASGREAEEGGHDFLLSVLDDYAKTTETLVHTRFLNQGTFSPYRLLPQARPLKGGLTFSLNGTPLYRQALLTLGSVVAKTRQETEARPGRSVRTVTLIITDGEDTASGDTTASHVRFLVQDMMDIAGNHIVAGMGIGPSYERVFRSMGIPQKFIFEAGANAEEIKSMFIRFRTDVLEPAAKSGASFSQLLAG
jgi:hypothetical protein